MIDIIPAIDLIGRKCVRLSGGDFSKSTTYSADPLEVAKQFESVGIKRLHIVDLDGAKRGSISSHIKILEDIAKNTELIIDFGGGIKTPIHIAKVFEAGAEMVNLGSIAVNSPDVFIRMLEHFGHEKIILGADVLNEKISIDAWQTPTDLQLIPFLTNYIKIGGRKAFVTDISRDGFMNGPSIKLYKKVIRRFPDLEIIASGGVRTMDDVRKLEMAGCKGVIVGKALYEGNISLEELGKYVG